ncbi:MAG: aromatic ring-hydroxylating dioxygenase subunit alpha [Gammaproteobacteria bacterium]|nr:aromatic ring-hydroxylating dioxygenase subunit alpha [Gammaproteobacteria bacterium]
MSRAQLIDMAKENMAHARAGTIEQEADVVRVPASHYYDEKRWRDEMDRVFKRMPLLLATTAELRNPGDYKSLEAVGVPILISRGASGDVRAFVNMCSHRGAVIVPEGRGTTKRFTCPYHAWTYDGEGSLIAIYKEDDFGNIDKSCNGLTRLPVVERAGLIWVQIDPNAQLDIDTFLCGYDDVLSHFNFKDWYFFDARRVDGPNWKIAYDGYMDLYHLPILHKNTFGPNMPNQALYTAWGPHQRVSSPDPSLAKMAERPEAEWPESALIGGVWTIFPHVSIASFEGGGRSVMLSQLFPGDTPQTSYTIQNYLMEKAPDEAGIAAATEQFKLLEYVVKEEDYATGLRQQRALMTGAKSHVMFGRNEGGGHRFHRWVDKLIATDDDKLNALFRQSERYGV